MKITNGVNPDFADFDEIDDDAAEAFEEFDSGNLSFEELKNLVGPEAASAYAEQYQESADNLLDDPEDF